MTQNIRGEKELSVIWDLEGWAGELLLGWAASGSRVPQITSPSATGAG